MAKRKRTSRVTNKIEGASTQSLIKVDSVVSMDTPAVVYRSPSVAMIRSTLFSAEFEAIIELIARDRVYRQMLAGLGRRQCGLKRTMKR
jgi:hypothetical protein